MLAVQKAFLDNTLNRKLVNAVRHPEFDLWILNYTPACQFDRAWDEVTTQCRGLILDANGGIVARPFPKFFNLGERPETQPNNLPDLPFVVLEKVDGSLGILYRGADTRSVLRIATRGSFTSTQAQWATAWIRALPTAAQQRLHDLLDQRRTPLFEIVYKGIEGPVIHYDWEGLTLLSLMNNETGREAEWAELEALAHAIGCRLPTVYTFGSVGEVVARQPLLPPTFEGFVIRYANGLRVKVKGDQYSELFKAVTGFSARVVLEAMRGGHDEFFVRLPEELRPQADTIREQIQSQITEAQTKTRVLFAAAPADTRKDFAVWVKANAPPELQWVLFALFDGREPDWYRLVEVSRLSNGNDDDKKGVNNDG